MVRGGGRGQRKEEGGYGVQQRRDFGGSRQRGRGGGVGEMAVSSQTTLDT